MAIPLPTSAAYVGRLDQPEFDAREPPCAAHLEDGNVYLRDNYFKEIGIWPTVDLSDGYFTVLSPLSYEEVHPALRQEIFRLRSANKFEYLIKGEERFNGVCGTGSSNNWLEIAWCEEAGVAAILYRGKGVPPRVKWCDGRTPDEAIDEWCYEYVVPWNFADDDDDE